MRPLFWATHLFFAGVAILIVSCEPTRSNQTKVDSIEQIVTQKLGSYELIPSFSGAYTLFVQKIDPSAANTVTNFLVVESTSKIIILEKSFKPGYIKWIDNSTIEYLDAPGILKQNESITDYIKKIDLSAPKH
jgi:hypothetical protein